MIFNWSHFFSETVTNYNLQTPQVNSSTSEPAMGPVVPLFPHLPNFRGHNSGKRGNRAGIIERYPVGTNEVIFSSVTRTKNKGGWGLRCGRDRPWGIFQPTLPQKDKLICRTDRHILTVRKSTTESTTESTTRLCHQVPCRTSFSIDTDHVVLNHLHKSLAAGITLFSALGKIRKFPNPIDLR